jgi:5-methylcytosine-specific restriction endonuclease McrA
MSLSREEKRKRSAESQARYRAKYPERIKAAKARYRAEYPEKLKVSRAKTTAKRAEHYRQVAAKYRAEHRAQLNEHARQYRLDHLEECHARNLDHYYKNKETYDERSRQWFDANRERSNKLCRNNYWKDPEKRRADSLKYSKDHPEQIKLNLSRRRARKKGATGKHTIQDIIDLYEKQAGMCAACGVPLQRSGKQKYQIDHIVPLSPRNGGKSGSHDISNIQLLCRSCNSSKSNLSQEEWLKRRLR